MTSKAKRKVDETKEDIEETLRVMRNFKTDLFDINNYMPLSGTLFYDAMSEEEISAIDWRKAGPKSNENYFSKHLSPEELGRYRQEAYDIAESRRKKTMVRLGARAVADAVTGIFKK